MDKDVSSYRMDLSLVVNSNKTNVKEFAITWSKPLETECLDYLLVMTLMEKFFRRAVTKITHTSTMVSSNVESHMVSEYFSKKMDRNTKVLSKTGESMALDFREKQKKVLNERAFGKMDVTKSGFDTKILYT